ncbi:MAG: SDR family NAD(P)-dependent oxidoreductase [Actinomycetota bacterium]
MGPANSCAFDFSGCAVLVTGGTSGIGHATASAFADAGAAVTVTGTRGSAADYEVDLGRFTYHQLDTRDPAAIDALGARSEVLDVLVNNAGANFAGGLDEWDPDGFSAALELNVEGAMRLTSRCRAALTASVLPGGASVVNIVSMTAFRSTTVVPGYSAAKAALLALTRNLAVHWVDDGIRVNAVAPGLIATPMTAPMEHWPEMLDAELGKAAMARMGSVDEVAAAVLFLSCAASAYTTGAVFAIDGGYLAR